MLVAFQGVYGANLKTLAVSFGNFRVAEKKPALS